MAVPSVPPGYDQVRNEAGWPPSGSCGRLFASSSSRPGNRVTCHAHFANDPVERRSVDGSRRRCRTPPLKGCSRSDASSEPLVLGDLSEARSGRGPVRKSSTRQNKTTPRKEMKPMVVAMINVFMSKGKGALALVPLAPVSAGWFEMKAKVLLGWCGQSGE
ncbi:hypothetical protein EYF80_027342 [Liparis tanakae]|uniref:Uncharacterized protein n=1 Tax=Liparis tanakae TaxID=230148 RepID=A0A4Z2HC10_9TELE|nr:hypothetical protein EYF80_027342 [Liparis tanakae]